jgi:hypothetical protein
MTDDCADHNMRPLATKALVEHQSLVGKADTQRGNIHKASKSANWLF